MRAARKRTDVTTAPPPRVHAGHTDSAAELDKLEHQTSRIVAEPPAKTQKAPVYKMPSDHERPTGTAYQQTMPLHAHHNGASASAPRPAKPASPHPYGH